MMMMMMMMMMMWEVVFGIGIDAHVGQGDYYPSPIWEWRLIRLGSGNTGDMNTMGWCMYRKGDQFDSPFPSSHWGDCCCMGGMLCHNMQSERDLIAPKESEGGGICSRWQGGLAGGFGFGVVVVVCVVVVVVVVVVVGKYSQDNP